MSLKRQRTNIVQDYLGEGVRLVGETIVMPTNGSESVVPFEAQKCIDDLLNFMDNGRLRLSQATVAELEAVLDCKNDLSVIDPLVVVSCTVRETYTARLREVVPISALLVAIARQERTVVGTLFAEARVQPYTYKERVNQYDPTGCEDVLEQLSDAQLLQVRGLMASLGPLSPMVVTDRAWITDHAKLVNDAMSGKTIYVERSSTA